MVVEIFNANVTYSVKQLTADCVDETSVHHGFNVDNDYNIRFRTVYKVASVSVIGYRWYHSYNVVILDGIEINEQLSLRNSSNALCYQTNYANFVFPTMFMNEVLKLTSSCHEIIR